MTSKDWSRLVGSITPNLHHSRGMIFWQLHPGWKKGLRSVFTGKVWGFINLPPLPQFLPVEVKILTAKR
jgi:hypothetical protein